MLERLDDIDWQSLSHAYGSAADVPDQLRALAFGENEEREAVLWSLYGNIYHQGTVYQATAYAVPFLVEILTAPTFHYKAEILYLLAHLASGHSYLDAHQDFEWEKQKAAADPEGYQAQMREELGWVKAARDAVLHHHADYIALLDADEPKSRATAAYLLSCFLEHHPQFLPAIYKRLEKESDSAIEGGLLLTVGYLSPYESAESRALVEPYLAPDNPLITRWAAAMTLSRLLNPNPPDEVLTLFVKILQSNEAIAELDDAITALPWCDGGILGATCTTLGFMSKARVAPYLTQIFSALPEVSWMHMASVVYALLNLVFEGQAMPQNYTVAELDELQRRTLTAIADHTLEIRMEDGKLAQNANITSLLRSFQLPDSKEKLLAFLQGNG